MRWSIVNFKVWSIYLYIFLRFPGRLRKVPESRGCLVWQFIVPSQTRCRPAPFQPNLRWAHFRAQNVYCTGYFTLLLWRGDEALRVDLRNGFTLVCSGFKSAIGTLSDQLFWLLAIVLLLVRRSDHRIFLRHLPQAWTEDDMATSYLFLLFAGARRIGHVQVSKCEWPKSTFILHPFGYDLCDCYVVLENLRLG